MTAMLATLCVNDLVAKVDAYPAFSNKVWHVYSEEELLAKQKGAIFPAVGVIYDGTRSRPPQSGEDSPGGSAQSADVSCTILTFFRQSPQSSLDPKDTIIGQMDALRSTILRTRSPTGHF